jgi:hypothetical protein
MGEAEILVWGLAWFIARGALVPSLLVAAIIATALIPIIATALILRGG